MRDQFCKNIQVFLQQLVESQKTALFSLYVLNFVFCPVATLGNALAIHALWKASSLPPNVRKLLLSLAFSDLAVGLVAHTTFAAVFVISAALKVDVHCQPILTISLIGTFCVAWASFLNVTAIAVDRLLAISLHLRYAEFVTSKRATIILVAIWLISCVFSLVYLMKYDYYVIVAILGSIGFPLTTFACYCVYIVARYHQKQIQAQFQHQNAQAMVLLRERKSALNVVYIYIVFVACYLPRFCSVFAEAITGNPSVLSLFALFFLFLNSSLNPLVYCWRLREVRQIMKVTLKKIFRLEE
ncbi:PREDICTED: adenosine receptor A2b-like [Acropora digitifera]|uniref:adenosine receptor A2b-like n=1 Tax=Acropora digitifera TaxID=70779 RepID=UPI00077A537C|nr:PREDICTED: adenosine receptor A2b-like [Acropora digitifera]